jgi:hypothetical protein
MWGFTIFSIKNCRGRINPAMASLVTKLIGRINPAMASLVTKLKFSSLSSAFPSGITMSWACYRWLLF